MIKAIVFMFALFTTASCAATPADSPLPDDYFSGIGECVTFWSSLLEDWKRHGGGVSGSIEKMREQIAKDEKSFFSAVVRESWGAQEASQAEKKASLGRWPVTAEHFRRVTYRLLESELLEDTPCKSGSELPSLLWNELRDHSGDPVRARRLQEMPDELPLSSPDAQKWLMYWIFTRVE